MKKSLLALAVMGAFAGAAHAQSSLTIYGLLDQGVIYNSNGNAAGQSKTTLAAGTQSSRFGFTGTEDLGGGLKASFRLESQIQPDTGTTDTPTAPLFRRAANISLAGGFGSVTLGRQTDPFYIAYAGGDTRPSNLIGSSLQPFLRATATALGSNITPLWVDNGIAYTTPTFGGVKATAYYSFGETAGDNSAGKQQGLTVNFASGPLTVNAGIVQRYADDALTTATATVNAALPAALRAPAPAGEKVGQAYTVNGGYTFGPATVRASWSRFENPEADNVRKFDVYGLSALYAASATIDVSAGYYRFDDKNINANDTNIIGLEADYKLSKRTTLYAAYGRSSKANVISALHSPTGSATSAVNTGAASLQADSHNVFGFGVRHAF